MKRLAFLVLAPVLLAMPALAQDPHAGHPPAAAAPAPADPHAGHQMPPQATTSSAAPAAAPQPGPADPHAGHQMPMPGPSSPGGGSGGTEGGAAAADPHAGHAMPMPMPAAPAGADPHAGHGAPAGGKTMTAAGLPVGNAPPPPVIRDNAADRVFGVGPMVRARNILANEHGAVRLSQVMVNIAEYRSGPPGGGYRWDLEAWYGGDINRLVFRTEGEGTGREGMEAAEAQLLYSRAVARYTDLQVGLRHDLEPNPSRTYATVGFESMLPYWFEVEGAAFLSNEGELTARLEGAYDLRLTQRLILQPQTELSFSAQEIPELDIGTGLTNLEFGLRLRYEIRREFAPYIGVTYERALGDTADFIHAAGEEADEASFVVGLRAWF